MFRAKSIGKELIHLKFDFIHQNSVSYFNGKGVAKHINHMWKYNPSLKKPYIKSYYLIIYKNISFKQ